MLIPFTLEREVKEKKNTRKNGKNIKEKLFGTQEGIKIKEKKFENEGVRNLLKVIVSKSLLRPAYLFNEIWGEKLLSKETFGREMWGKLRGKVEGEEGWNEVNLKVFN